MFKVFVYSKKTSKKIGTFTNVLQVTANDTDKLIEIYTGEDELITFDTTVYKTTVYQN
ncbi:MAG: hypothetical protein IKB67_04635 [Clostridia bacterium]|nr:hypothetical protein [Clostridia bacterium]